MFTTTSRFKLGLFVLTSTAVVLLVFGFTSFLEKTILASVPFTTLKYVYMIRGSSASLGVMLLAILFIKLERRHLTLQLRKLAQAVEQSPSSVIITDHNSRIEYVNPRFTRLTGYRGGEVIGKKPSILKSGKTPPQVYQNLWETLADGREWKGEFLNRKKNGELYWEAAAISPLKSQNGQITHFIGVLEDVTERKKIETLKDELIGRVSHELRTPLTVIKWAVRNLEDGLFGSIPKEQTEQITRIANSVVRLEKVINEVLDLTRLESGKTPAHLITFNLASLLRESLGDCRGQLENGDLVIEEEIPDSLQVTADPDKIIQVLNNLVENALRFASSRILVRAAAREGFLIVSVIDDGPGIEPDDQRRLFSKFERLSHAGRREQYKGTGLGLAICKEILLQHRGRIWVESTPGNGAQFHFKIPAGDEVLNQEVRLNGAA